MAGKADLALDWILLFSASQILPLELSHKNTRARTHTLTRTLIVVLILSLALSCLHLVATEQ